MGRETYRDYDSSLSSGDFNCVVSGSSSHLSSVLVIKHSLGASKRGFE